MPRVKPRVTSAGRARTMLMVLGASCTFGAACSVFSLGDVVPTDGDGGGSVDGSTLDGNATTDGDVVDSARGPCVAGGNPCYCLPAPLLLNSGGDNGKQIVVHGSTVYYMLASGVDPAIFSVPIDGSGASSPTPISPGTEAFGTNVMVYGGGWLFFRGVSAPVGIDHLSIDGGTTTPSYFPIPMSPHDVTANSTTLFFGASGGSVCGIPFNGAVPMGSPGDSGCATAPLVNAHPGGNADQSLFANDTLIFGSYGDHIVSAPVTGGVMNPIVTPSPFAAVSSLVESGGLIFWSNVNAEAGTIWSALDDGGSQTQIIDAPFEPEAGIVAATIAADTDGIYWSGTGFESRIWSATASGGNPRLTACGPANIQQLTTDSTSVYWIDSNGAVYRAPKN